MGKTSQLAKEILEEIEKRGFTQGEAELLPQFLSRQIEENSKRLEYNKPFAVFKFTDDSNDQ